MSKRSVLLVLSLGALLATALSWRTRPSEGGETIGILFLASNALLCYGALCGLLVGISGRDMGRRARGVAIMTISLGAVLVILELPAVFTQYDWWSLRVFSDRQELLKLSRAINRPDEELIHIHWPNTEFRGEVFGNLVHLGVPDAVRYPVDVGYDRNGFRNDRELERADVAIIGDSFVEAALVPLEQTLAARLEDATGLVSANLGQAAYGLQQELLVLKRFALPLEPRTVLWFLFGGNDLRDIDRYEIKRNKVSLDNPSNVRPWRERLFTTNALIALSRALSDRALRQRAWSHSGTYVDSSGEKMTMYFATGDPQYREHELAFAQETLLEARSACEAAGVRFLVVYIPRKFRVYWDACEFEPGSKGADTWKTGDLPEVLGLWAREEELPFLDTTQALREKVRAGRSVYFRDDVHWNAEGNAAAAELVVETLRREGWWAPD